MSHRHAGPLPAWLAPLARVAALGYGAVVRARGSRNRSARRLPFAVISVGNITAGGTGKTPFVRWCAADLRAAGHSPAIALRGYASRGGRSDEAEEYRALLPEVPLAVGADRAASLARLRHDHPGLDCAVLDDAFQHRKVERDLDVVLVDATRPGLEGALLPAGWLREPATGLARADLVVVTRADHEDPALAALVRRFHGRAPAAWTRHAWREVDVFECRAGEPPVAARVPTQWLRGRRAVVAAAIGNPAPFAAAAEAVGCLVQALHLRRDHAAYSPRLAQALATDAALHGGILLTTWKDWTKLGAALAAARDFPAVTVAVPRVEVQFLSGEHRVREALRAAASRGAPGAGHR